MNNRREAEGAEGAEIRIRELSGETNHVTGNLIAAAIEVHKVLGPGLLEALYEQALAIELNARRIPFVRQLRIPTYYKEQLIGESRLDMLVANHIVVELKSVTELTGFHCQQVLSYLRAGGFEIGLLLNFNVRRLIDGVRRVICTY